MSLITLTIRHGRTKEEAVGRLETAVCEVSTKLGTMVRRVDWAAERDPALAAAGTWRLDPAETIARHRRADIRLASGTPSNRAGP